MKRPGDGNIVRLFLALVLAGGKAWGNGPVVSAFQIPEKLSSVPVCGSTERLKITDEGLWFWHIPIDNIPDLFPLWFLDSHVMCNDKNGKYIGAWLHYHKGRKTP